MNPQYDFKKRTSKSKIFHIPQGTWFVTYASIQDNTWSKSKGACTYIFWGNITTRSEWGIPQSKSGPWFGNATTQHFRDDRLYERRCHNKRITRSHGSMSKQEWYAKRDMLMYKSAPWTVGVGDGTLHCTIADRNACMSPLLYYLQLYIPKTNGALSWPSIHMTRVVLFLYLGIDFFLHSVLEKCDARRSFLLRTWDFTYQVLAR